jgi:hypothetical protein
MINLTRKQALPMFVLEDGFTSAAVKAFIMQVDAALGEAERDWDWDVVELDFCTEAFTHVTKIFETVNKESLADNVLVFVNTYWWDCSSPGEYFKLIPKTVFKRDFVKVGYENEVTWTIPRRVFAVSLEDITREQLSEFMRHSKEHAVELGCPPLGTRATVWGFSDDGRAVWLPGYDDDGTKQFFKKCKDNFLLFNDQLAYLPEKDDMTFLLNFEEWPLDRIESVFHVEAK